MENKKSPQTPKADAGLFLWAANPRGSRASEASCNPLFFTPKPPKGGLNPL